MREPEFESGSIGWKPTILTTVLLTLEVITRKWVLKFIVFEVFLSMTVCTQNYAFIQLLFYSLN